MFKFVVLGIAILLGSCNSQSPKCDVSGSDQIDEYTRWLFFFGDPLRKLPKVKSEIKQVCSEVQQKEKLIKEYSQKCLSAFPKQITNLLMYGIIRKNKYYCTSKRGKNEVLLIAKCANKVKPNADKCMDTMIEDTLGALHADPKVRVPMACCIYYNFEECVEREATKVGSPECAGNSIKLIEQMLDAYTGDMLRYMCGDYVRDNDKCSKFIIPKKKPNQKKSKSILPAFIDVLESV